MSRNFIHRISIVFCLSLIPTIAAQAELVGWWEFNEGSGNIVLDSSGNDNNGTLHDNAGWSDGKIGLALQLSGADGHGEIPFSDSLRILNQGDFTISAWLLANVTPPPANKLVLQQTDLNGTGRSLLFLHSSNEIRTFAGGAATGSGVAMEAGEWVHAAVVVTELGATDSIQMFVNGIASGAANTSLGMESCEGQYHIGSHKNVANNVWDGLIDDLRIYNHALTESELAAAMEGTGEGYPFARSPSPADGTLHPDTWVTLTWSPGDFAVSHDVYLGDNFDEVDNGTGDTFQGSQTTTMLVVGFPGFPFPEGLVPGTTYYWRIDEVNEADPNSPWKGPIWSFSIPPKTAYNPDPADGAEFVDPNNVTLSWTPGFGAILHTAYFGDDYDEVNNATGGAPLGGATYKPGPLEREKVYYWRVDEFDAAETHKGDIWSFTTPGAVGNANPANGSADVGMNAILSWIASDSADSHELYLGTDKETVRNADKSSAEYKGSSALSAESHDPGLLDAGTTYYWRVDEVDAQGNTTKGPLWIFTTGAFLSIDDFEGYTDDDAAGEAIWQTWVDGFGIADNGAQAGYLLPPYAEQNNIHGGSQSMPLLYTNEGSVTNSEASLTLAAARDWTQANVAELSLWFRGGSANAAEPLYVSVANTAGAPAVVAQDDLNAAQTGIWTQWIIPLQAIADQGITLTNVDKFAVGLGTKSGTAGPGGSGTIFIDDIRLSQ
jgi:hypothetical protein